MYHFKFTPQRNEIKPSAGKKKCGMVVFECRTVNNEFELFFEYENKRLTACSSGLIAYLAVKMRLRNSCVQC